MSNHPLFTDTTIPLSVTLAATIGLEEALLLTIFNQAAQLQPQSQRNGIRISRECLRQQLPFWDDVTIRRTLASLIEKGMVQLHGPMYPESAEMLLGFDSQNTSSQPLPSDVRAAYPPQGNSQNHHSGQPVAHSPQHGSQQPSQHNTPRYSSIGADWKPSQDTLTRLQQRGIGQSFVWAQLDSFILHAQEAGPNRNDWNARFFNHVKNQWVYAQNDAERQKQFQQEREEQQLNRSGFKVAQDEAAPIQPSWRPSADALQILQRADIDQQFIEDAIPEFVLYWSERGDAVKTWNTKFLQHVRSQWARYSASMEHSNVPMPIDRNWQPSSDCYDILAMAHIDTQFARERVAEFVLYWRDSGQVHNSWNSRFLQYVKQQWGKRLAQSGDAHGTASNQSAAQPGYTTAEASVQRLNDTSW